MELELKNFRIELDKRFKKSTINGYTFPLRKESRESIRLNQKRGAYVLPNIQFDSSKDISQDSFGVKN